MITIFTPVYNRAYIVENLYHSLLRQTCYDFEWLIIDDGSTDNVGLPARQWKENTQEFKIRFYQQENRGKHAAINYGVKLAKYEMFFIVDSDDYLENDAVETILKYWDRIGTDCCFAGISGLRRSRNGEIIGGRPAFEEFVDATNLEREKYGLEGDKAEVFRTELLRKYPFPEYENETFLTEAVVWDRLAYEGYKIRWINKSFMVCEYLQDGLTAKGEKLFWNNPKGWAYFLKTKAIYRAVERSVYLKECYYYYECEHAKFQGYEMKEMLDLDETEIHMIVEEYTGFRQRLSELCADRKVSIYAYGQWGKRLKRYLDDLIIHVDYVIDQRYKEIKEIRACSIEMDLPKTDILFVALDKEAYEVKEAVRKKMPETEVISCRDIIPVMW